MSRRPPWLTLKTWSVRVDETDPEQTSITIIYTPDVGPNQRLHRAVILYTNPATLKELADDIHKALR